MEKEPFVVLKLCFSSTKQFSDYYKLKICHYSATAASYAPSVDYGTTPEVTDPNVQDNEALLVPASASQSKVSRVNPVILEVMKCFENSE